MVAASYSFDPATEKDSRSRRRRIAEQLMMQGMDTSPIQHPMQGAARMAQALMGGIELGMEDRKERELAAAQNAYGAKLDAELSGAGASAAPKLTVAGALAAPPENIKAIIDANVPPEDREYAYRMAAKESNYNPTISSPTGAKGLFQFTGRTGKSYGLVNDEGDFRGDPVRNTQAFVQFTRDNREGLRRVLGRDPTPGELAVAHQQGLGGATALLTGKGTVDPNNLRVQAGNPKNASDIMRYYGYSQEPDQPGPFRVAQANTGGGTMTDANRLMQIATDRNAPPEIRERARLMLSQIPKPADPLDRENKALQNQKLRNEVNTPPPTPLTPEERQQLGLRPDVPAYRQGKEIKFGPANTSINNAVNTNPGPSKNVYESVEKQADVARAAAAALPSFAEAKRLVDSGSITLGAGADTRVALQKFGALFGMDATSASNAELFKSVVAPQVFALIKNLGAGSGISNNDLKFAEKAAGGDINLEPATLRRLMNLGERAARLGIERHQKMLDEVYPESDPQNRQVRSLFRVDPSAYTLPEVQAADPGATVPPPGAPKAQGDGWTIIDGVKVRQK